MSNIDWYFDFISPYAYLASESLDRLQGDVEINAKPILFAGLLKKWDTKGPAEIEPMRKFTYRQIAWLAEQNGIPLRFPPVHPFNPLRLLRLHIALGGGVPLAQLFFRFIWCDGMCADHPDEWVQLIDQLGLTTEEANERISDPAVKQQLIKNTEEAIEKGIFGVPGFVVNDEVFWGFDSLNFVNDYLADADLFQRPDMVDADSVGTGVKRS